MDKQFEHGMLHAPQAEAEYSFETNDDPVLHELFEKACFIDFDKIEGISAWTKGYLVSHDRNKIRILESTKQKLTEAQFGTLNPESRESKPITRRVSFDTASDSLVVEDIKNNKAKTKITRGLAIEAARSNSFDGVQFELGNHEVETLRRIIRSRALSELEEIRDKEMAIIKMGGREARNIFEKKFGSIGAPLKDKSGGEIAEELVGSFMRTLAEDGIIPFNIVHADIIDDVLHHIDFFCDVPNENIPPSNQKPGSTHERHAIDITVSRGPDLHLRKTTEGIMHHARNSSRPESDQINKFSVIPLILPHREGDYVSDWISRKQGTFRGPEMSLDSVTRERILNLFLNKVCWFLSQKQKDEIVAKMHKTYAGMYRR